MSYALFSKNQSGQTMVLFGFCLVPLCYSIGFVFDQNIQIHRKLSVQSALDAAILSAAKAKQNGATETEITANLTKYLEPHIGSLPGLECDPVSIILPPSGDQIQASIECDQATTLMHIMGRDEMPLKVDSAASYEITSIDVAFMFDVSGSMNSENRLIDLKAAATDALDILLPREAPADLVEHTRVAIASFSNVLNAGPFFKQVTGLEPTRTFTANVEVELNEDSIERGRQDPDLNVYLYDAKRGDRIAEIGDGALIKVEEDQLDRMTIVVEPDSSYRYADDIESITFELSDSETASATENVEPYSMYGDSGIDNLSGESWTTGRYELDLRVFDGKDGSGNRLLNRTFKFELFKDGDTQASTRTYTLNSTCVWERDGDEKFTDAPPGTDQYLAAQSAWFQQYQSNSPAGRWRIGFNENGEKHRAGSVCDLPPPVELTNNRALLDRYISTMSADGGTAGHLGVAWTWYLISDRWSAIFDDTATPAPFSNSSIKKAVILMTDGAFNIVGHLNQGDSPTQASALCDGMKDRNILVYAVAFKAPTLGQDVLRDCATDAGTFFNATSKAELEDAYTQIAAQLSDLRLSQ